MSDALGLDAATRSCVYYVALLRFLGCTSDASETAVLAGGDDVAFNAHDGADADGRLGRGHALLRASPRRGSPAAPAGRGGSPASLADPAAERRSLSSHCEVAARLGGRLGLGDAVSEALAHAYERWDGKGYPSGLGRRGGADRGPGRVGRPDAEMWARDAGWSHATDVLARRRGHAHDPAVVDVLLAEGEAWLAAIGDDPCAAVLDAEPAPQLTIGPADLDQRAHRRGGLRRPEVAVLQGPLDRRRRRWPRARPAPRDCPRTMRRW